jgi:YhgE/Pip-like protein
MTETSRENSSESPRAILRLRKTWAMPAALAGTLIALITLIYVGSVVNPAGHLSGLPVALVDQDRGVTLGRTHVDLGQDIVAGLRSSPKVTKPIALTVTSMAGARRLMDTDKSYATVVIPPDLSATTQQAFAAAGPPPAITVLTNQRAGTLGDSLAATISEKALTAAVQQVTAKAAAATGAQVPAALQAEPVSFATRIYRPLPDHSALGLSAFYIALLTIMCGFLGATITNSSIDSATGFAPTEIGPRWRLRRPLAMSRWHTLLVKWSVAAVIATVLDTLMLLVAVGALRMYAPHVLVLWLFTAFAAIVVGLGTLVLFACFGSLGQLLGMLVFLYLSLASSGGTIPIQALPEPLRWAADVEPLRQVLGGVRATMYFDMSGDAGLTRGLIMTGIGLVFWLLAGFGVTRLYDRRGLARISPEALAFVNRSIAQARVEAGKTPTTSATAGRAVDAAPVAATGE